MSVHITINGENASEALIELATLAAGISGGQVAPVAEPEKPKSKRTASVAVKADPEPEKQPDPEPDDDDEDYLGVDPTPVPTDVDLRAAASEKGKTAGKAPIKSLLDKYGVPNVTAIPDDKRIAFLAELNAI